MAVMSVTGEAEARLSSKGDGFELLGLPEISLRELFARTELFKWTNRKYLVPDRTVAEMAGFLCDIGARVLAIDGLQALGYLLDYYDTLDFALYRAAATKRRRRPKLCSRAYLDSRLHFMELKTRSGRGQNVKDRLRLEDVRSKDYFYRGDPAKPLKRSEVFRWAAKLLVRRGVTATHGEGFRTLASLVSSSRSYYRRSTLCLSDDSRLTIDQGLVLAGVGEVSGFESPEMVVETKSSGCASDIDRWLWSRGIRPSRVSKYAISTVVVHPELPTNHWHSTMTKLGMRR